MQSYLSRYCGIMTAILSRIVEAGNAESGSHVMHISSITGLLLKQMVREKMAQLSESDIALISAAAALHDIGKSAVPAEILNKPDKLSAGEAEIMRTHTRSGADILDSLPHYGGEPFVCCARDICLWHHERWDGGGYPDGLAGDEIPLSAQAVSLADVYDALRSQRCYKAAIPHEEAMEMILGGKCGSFNPLLLSSFTAISGELEGALSAADLEGCAVRQKGN